MKLKFDREKANRLYSINTAEILEEQSEELNDLRIYLAQHNITGQPPGIKQLAELYVKQLKKLSIIKAESISDVAFKLLTFVLNKEFPSFQNE